MAKYFRLGLSVLVCSGFAAAPMAAQDVVITEIMTLNSAVLEDEDGDASDWLELYNSGAAAVDLGGWYLSDDAAMRTKWRFPSLTLDPSEFLVVFASDKDRRIAGAPLHTNFKLTSGGENLLLVAPDGTTVVWSYQPYPPQAEDFSWGLAQNATQLSLVRAGAAARTQVPGDGSLGLTWTQRVFNDAAWTQGSTGVGYDRNPDYASLILTNVRTAMDGVNTSAYIRIPFQVDDPSRLSGLLLRMKYDDGFSVYINGVQVASRNAPATPAWNSTATALHDDADAVIFEEIALPGAAGLLVAGTNVLAVHGLNDNLNSSDFLILPELDGTDPGVLDRDTRLYFPQPTPGGANLMGVPAVAPRPSLSPPSRVFTGNLQVSLSSPAAEGFIHYTLNGSEPTESSPVYSGPLSLTTSTMVRARVVVPGQSLSAVVSETYLSLAADVVNFSSNIPVMVLDNFGAGSVPANSFQPVFFAVFEPAAGRSRLTNPPDLATRAGIKLRGSSTQGQPKPNLTLEAWDEKNQDKDIIPLDLPDESDWILHAPYGFDRALIRNPLIYDLSNQVGRYATRSRFVEVYLNTGGGSLSSADYFGVYSFMEKIKRGPDRVDVEELTASHTAEPEISGGYMMKIDRLDPGDSGFSAAGRTLAWVYPKEDNVSGPQTAWLTGYMNAFLSALNGANFRDPALGYLPYVDVLSWVDHHILNVLAKNVDALRLSTYFYKRRGGPIEYGPIWDFDRSMNSTDGRDDDPRTWNGTGDGTDYFNYPWWARLFQDPDFWQAWRDRWYELRRGPLSTANVNGTADGMANEIREAQVRNFQRWSGQGGPGFQGEIDLVKNWLATRSTWIDSQFLAPPALSRAGGPISPGTQVTISAAAGAIYYTLDGSDPRRRGGTVAPGATAYSSPLVLNGNVRVVARTRRSDSDWSAPAAATYYVSLPSVVISEIMYHPPFPPPSSPFDAEEFEFIELLNIGSAALDLAGAAIGGGVGFVFPGGPSSTLNPGERLVVVENLEAFASRYDVSSIKVAGQYTDKLENDGEELVLEGPLREPILAFTYSPTWYPITGGSGYSLNIFDPFAPAESWTRPESWTPSTVLFGTPGRADPGISSNAGWQRQGDGNQDGIVDISDAVAVLLRLFGAAAPLPCEGPDLAAGGNLGVFDVNGDTGVDLSDAVYLLGFLFQSGPAPRLGTTCVRLEGCASVCF